jgi:hypothetical protein
MLIVGPGDPELLAGGLIGSTQLNCGPEELIESS